MTIFKLFYQILKYFNSGSTLTTLLTFFIIFYFVLMIFLRNDTYNGVHNIRNIFRKSYATHFDLQNIFFLFSNLIKKHIFSFIFSYLHFSKKKQHKKHRFAQSLNLFFQILIQSKKLAQFQPTCANIICITLPPSRTSQGRQQNVNNF